MLLVNPADGSTEEIEETAIETIADIVARARAAQRLWSERSIEERIAVLEGLSPLMEQRIGELAACITRDMGKPLHKSIGEVTAGVMSPRFFCENAPDWLAHQEVEGGFVCHEPLGVVAVISPWNYPCNVPLLAIVPALLTGNSVVFKPSEHAVRIGKALGKLFHDLKGFPEDLLQLVIGAKDHGRALVEQDVDMIAFTGSGVAGKDIMKRGADRMKRLLLELGGMDAAIVLKDVDVPKTAAALVAKNCNNSGQICCAVKRVYVEREIFEDFVAAAVNESKNISLGDPSEKVDMGPVVGDFQLEKLEAIVEDARSKGATVHSGGKRLERDGFYFPSTVVTDLRDDMRVLTEEPFGPILPILPVDDWQEAVTLANDSRYGLTGSVWTNKLNLAQAVARKLEVGVVAINSHGPGPLGTPFGGVKESGIGRVKTKEGMLHFTNTKYVKLS